MSARPPFGEPLPLQTKAGLLNRMWDSALEADCSLLRWALPFLLLHLTFRYIKEIVLRQVSPHPAQWVLPIGMGIALGLSVWQPRRSKRYALCVAGGLCFIEMSWRFPMNSNHSWVEVLLLMALCIVKTNSRPQRELFVVWGRWLVALLFLHSGLQKVLHGVYFRGAFLGTRVREESDDNFGLVMRLLLEPSEQKRLVDGLVQGYEGSYFLNSRLGLVVSNAIYLSELLTALLLFFPRTRFCGSMLAVSLLLGIEATALEMTFGLLTLNLTMLFFRQRLRTPVAILSALGYLGLAVAQAIVGPKVSFFI